MDEQQMALVCPLHHRIVLLRWTFRIRCHFETSRSRCTGQLQGYGPNLKLEHIKFWLSTETFVSFSKAKQFRYFINNLNGGGTHHKYQPPKSERAGNNDLVLSPKIYSDSTRCT